MIFLPFPSTTAAALLFERPSTRRLLLCRAAPADAALLSPSAYRVASGSREEGQREER